MSETTLSASRRKRIKRIKIYLITIFVILLITPTVISVYTMNRMSDLNDCVDDLTRQIDQMELSYLLKETAHESLEEMTKEIDENQMAADTQTMQIETKAYESEAECPEGYKKVYLTFDDGPSPYTTEILDILDSYGVKATFFVTGIQKDKHPEWYKEIVDRGHSIGMHSYTHVYKQVYANEEAFLKDVEDIHELIKETTGVNATLYRFPGGSSNSVSTVSMGDLFAKIHDQGYEYFDWNISSQDASNPTPSKATITYNVLSGIDKFDNCVVLMHDAADKYATVQALPGIIEGIMKKEKTVILPIGPNTETVWHLTGDEEED